MKAARHPRGRPPKRHAVGVGADGAGQNYSSSQSVPPTAPPRKPFVVNVHGERTAAWGAYVKREDAEAVAAKLRRTCGFVVTVEEVA